MKGPFAGTRGTSLEQLIYKLKAVKAELKKWYKLRATDNPIHKMQADFITLFYQTDNDPEDPIIFENMYEMGQRLK